MDRIERFLREREKKHLLRVLCPASYRKKGLIFSGDREYINFSSNDYLGLSSHEKLKQVSSEAAVRLGVGGAASRLLSGDLGIYHWLEEKTARFKGKESALVLNSGYQANVGMISALCKRGDVIFSDKLNHASIVDGALLSGARLLRFFHNDLNNLAYLLKKERYKFKKAFIVTETVFSMDGDKPDLRELVSLKDKYNCEIIVDEAHATGVFGENGAGVVGEEGLSDKIDVIMGTFSKSLGSFGAYICCSKKVKKYLINVCRSFIYSTALPPSVIAVNLASLDLIDEEPFRRKELLINADWFREKLRQKGFEVRGCSQIVPLIVQDSQKAVDISKKLQDRGYWVLPIRPPTVPAGKSRLRFSLTYHHTKDMLDSLIKDIYGTVRV